MTYHIMPSCTMSQLETRVNDLFNMAEVCKWTSSELHARCREQITDPLNFRTSSGKRRHSVWFAGFGEGLVRAAVGRIWREKVEFCYLVEGALYSTWRESSRRTTEEFYVRGIGHVLADAVGRHYWIGSDKPF